MLKIEVRELMGIDNAEIDLEKGDVLEVIGPNASGKTSLAVCASALLARKGNPLSVAAGLARKAYYRHGNTEGTAILTQDKMGEYVEWKPANSSFDSPAEGIFAEALCRPETVGLVDFCAKLGDKPMAMLFQSILLPPEEEVNQALRDTLREILSPDDLAGVLEVINDNGWEKAESIYSDRSRKAQRDWAEITGEKYGIRKAADWQPKGWLSDYDGITVIEAQTAVATARDALMALHRVDAISEAEAEQAEQAKRDLPGLKEVAEAARDKAKAALNEWNDAVSRIQQLHGEKADLERSMPEPKMKTAQLCPHCQGQLMVKAGRIVHFEDDGEEIDAEREKIQAKIKDVNSCIYEASEEEQRTSQINSRANAALGAANAELNKAVAESEKTGELDTEERQRAIALAEEEVETSRRVVELIEAREKAANLHKSVQTYMSIGNSIGPKGVRTTMLEKGLKKLNSGLGIISETSGWPLVQVGEKGEITFGKDEPRPVHMCSESEKWRTQASLQLTIAALMKDPVVVLDRADMLDLDNRKGLIKALQRVTAKKGFAVLVCSTWNTTKVTVPWKQIVIQDGRTANEKPDG